LREDIRPIKIVAGCVDDDKEDLYMSKRVLTLLSLAAVVALPLIAGAQDASSAGPKLVVPDKIIDLGVIPKGEVVDVNFSLINEGTEPILIKTVRPTCSCTVADFSKEIAPGEKGYILAKVDTAELKGPISKALLLLTNDVETPSMSLVIKAVVQPFIDVYPKPLVRISSIQGELVEEKVILASTVDDGKSFEVVKVSSDNKFLKAKVRKLTKQEQIDGIGSNQHEVDISLAKDAPPGPITSTVTVLTDHPKAKRVVIKVFGVIRALLQITPPTIQFGVVDAQARPGPNILVVNNDHEQSVQLSDATIDDPAFSTNIITIEEGKRYQVTVTLNPDAAPGSKDTTLRLHTSDKRFSELTVPVRASIR